MAVFGLQAIYFGCGDLGPPQPHCTPADPGGGAYVLADLEHMRGMMKGSLPPKPITPSDFVVAVVKGRKGHLAISSGDAQTPDSFGAVYNGPRPTGFEVMKKEGGIVLGIGGDNSPCKAVAASQPSKTAAAVITALPLLIHPNPFGSD